MGYARKEAFAKISRPSTAGIFPRKRLFRRLDEGSSRPVTFITGPPGSGKTSLVTSYLKDRNLPCLWYQVDEGDSDLATFFYYTGLAAKKAAPRYKTPLPLFTPEYGLGVLTFTRRYFETFCSRLKPPCVLVFDNYQEIPSESVMHEVFRTGLSVFPRDITCVIMSRSGPPATFAAIEAANKLHVIGWNDLKLTPEESKGIAKLQEVAGPQSKLYEWLHEKAGGWAAGLVLLSRAVTSNGNNPQGLDNIEPDKVFDYFANEMFDRIDRPLQDFLLKTAFVPKITPGLAEDLTGNKSAGKILSNLNQRNYFTEKRTQPEVIYQYHALFREFLIARAASRFPSKQLSGLRLEAAKLLEASGQTEDAAELFVQAGAWDELRELIPANALKLIRQGRNQLLEKWVTSLPDELLKSDPWLNYWLGVCRLPFNPAESRAFLEHAFQLFISLGDGPGTLLAWSGVVQAFLYEFDDFKPLDRWIAWLDERTAKGASFPSPEIALSVSTGMTSALTWRIPGHPDIQKWAERAVSLSKNSADIEACIRAYTNNVVYHIWMGTFNECSMLIREMKKMIASQPVSPLRSIVLKHAEAMFYNTSAEFQKQALQSVLEGLQEVQETGVHAVDPWLYNQGVISCLNEGDAEHAEEFLLKLEKALRSGSRTHTGHYFYLSACYYLYIGEAAQAVFSAKRSLDLLQETGAPVSEVIARLALSHSLFEAGNEEEANRELTATKRTIMQTGSLYFEYLYGLTEAYFEYARANDAAALQSLRKAMTLGREKGFTTLLYFWRPAVMSLLCGEALEAGVETGYVQHLIRSLNLAPGGSSMEIESWPWSLKIFTLGRFEILRDEKPLVYPVRAPRVPLTLLKGIIAFGIGGVKEDQLVDSLWPESDGDTAHQALKTTLHRLRQLIGDERAIRVREGRVMLDQQYCWVDAYAFESLLEKAERLLEKNTKVRDSSMAGVRVAERALSLYRGPFLGEEANESWIIAYQERLRSKFIRVVKSLGKHFERNGQWERAVECYQKGLEVDELAEEIYERLMASYLSWGRRAEAIAVYNRCRKTLQSSLGVDPSPPAEKIFKLLKEKERD